MAKVYAEFGIEIFDRTLLEQCYNSMKPFSSYKKLAGYVLEEFKKNGLYTVKLGDDGKYYAQKVKLSDAEYERAKEILKDLNNRGLHE